MSPDPIVCLAQLHRLRCGLETLILRVWTRACRRRLAALFEKCES